VIDETRHPWAFEDTGHRPGVFNMAHDEELAEQLRSGAGRPTLRLYGWKPAAISLGWNQTTNEIDSHRAAEDGIDIVRRPTGGRAILHSDELTYSVVMRVAGRNILSVYDDISQALVAGLQGMGAAVGIEKAQPHFPSLYQTASAVACFSSSARYEIKCNGRKLIGSAQRRYSGTNNEEVVLQHGSILLGSDHLRMTEYLRFPTEEARSALRKELELKTIDLAQILDRTVSYGEAAEAIRRGFIQHWGCEFEAVTAGQPEESRT
jgi:lipoate-protein ligase A